MKLPSLNSQILIGCLLGVAGGSWLAGSGTAAAPEVLYGAKLVGNLFLDLLRMVLVPLVFSSIVVGVANLRAHDQMHRVWTTTLAFFFGTMGLAVVIGFGAAHLFRPGEGLQLEMFAEATRNYQARQMPLPDYIAQFLRGLFQNPFKALAQGEILAIVMIALFLGIALVVGGERYRNIRLLIGELQELCLMIVGWVMRLAPLGLAALLLQLVATQNSALLASLGHFIAVVIGSTLFHGLIVLPLILWLFTRISPIAFFKGSREALITAFVTSSSAATLPITLRCAEQHLHVKKDIASFVVPLGATVNMDGTALYEAAAALFVARLAGIELDIASQMIIFFVAMLGAIGAPGIPSVGMLSMVLVLESVGLPTEAIAILLPIDRILDTVRTAVNVEGDMVGSLIVQKVAGQSTLA
ncbi:dicarboxylate/amino acid:cation symporter [Ferribacterium limneticum]|uniref:dicarboxylate/amino acid:cation symporter n=1 Tax=Ferribacterium limneticum TaxID=76259 RepID=UPI001CF94E55|nr:dicarboxylate/amino acid:cation symporter [Ferribacterium limneticum]UCV29905.1 dicarboxylate/amino acid:cation symporter [Ferribacterium limneticum]UCV33824.1 dicarboxylate/amino acid:cation symporter [Ferribacterium limneticum]